MNKKKFDFFHCKDGHEKTNDDKTDAECGKKLHSTIEQYFQDMINGVDLQKIISDYISYDYLYGGLFVDHLEIKDASPQMSEQFRKKMKDLIDLKSRHNDLYYVFNHADVNAKVSKSIKINTWKGKCHFQVDSEPQLNTAYFNHEIANKKYTITGQNIIPSFIGFVDPNVTFQPSMIKEMVALPDKNNFPITNEIVAPKEHENVNSSQVTLVKQSGPAYCKQCNYKNDYMDHDPDYICYKCKNF